jgi:hypothetical protein
MRPVSFKCAAELDEMADQFECDGYARDVVKRLRDLAADVRGAGCDRSVLCRGCSRSRPEPEAGT